MDLTQYEIPVIIAICMCIGYVVKNSLDFIPNKYIPLIMLIIGVVLNVVVNKNISAEIILEGCASGLASTGTHQTCKCLKCSDKAKKNEELDKNDD